MYRSFHHKRPTRNIVNLNFLVQKLDLFNFLALGRSEGTGQKHYEALCMRAVNQSIGRAVRHSKDYAAVLLLDHRYSRRNTFAGLPSWIKTSLQTHEKFGPAFAQLAKPYY